MITKGLINSTVFLLVTFLSFGTLIILGCNGGGGGNGGNGGGNDGNGSINASPVVQISTPTEGSTYTVGDEIQFTGSGNDGEDGVLSGASLVWTSDLDGQIGTGERCSSDSLSVGVHQITLTGTDSKGAVGVDTLEITVMSADDPVPTAITIDVHMRAQRSKIVYAVWIQNTALSMERYLYICQTITQDMQQETSNDPAVYSKGCLGGRALPYFRTYVADGILWDDLSQPEQDEIDAVTGATVQGNHTFIFQVETTARQFQLFFEVDRSWDGNDWFQYSPQVEGFIYIGTSGKEGNQPAVLFAVDIDLNNLPPNNTFTMVPVGWTPHEYNPASGILTQDDLFQLFTDLRYITNKNDGGGGFGDIDPDRATLIMENESIEVTISVGAN